MNHWLSPRLRRRDFLSAAAAAGAASLTSRRRAALAAGPELQIGEGVVDITPPIGIEMGGFHRKPGQERRVRAIRQPAAVRALVLSLGDARLAICSLDVAAVGREMADRVRTAVARRTGIPAEAVRLCATHTHSMPGFCYLRQWGALPVEFMRQVEERTVEAVALAQADLAAGEVLLGKTRVVGGNHNRTVKSCPTDETFAKDSGDSQRWLDTLLQALVFCRGGGKKNLVWYHFSAHAVCYADEQAGPDWPGTVAAEVEAASKVRVSFLQGHTGDVNPGDGSDWRGEIRQTTAAIAPALKRAIDGARPLKVDCLRTMRQTHDVPFDMALFEQWRTQYRTAPETCSGGPWVDAGFAADWYRGNEQRKLTESHLPAMLSGVRLGPVGLVFHPAELYSYYGLAIRRDSPLEETLVVGYTDGCIGYLTDPTAYQKGEYAAVTVPKILDYPPFTPAAAGGLTAAALQTLRALC